MNSFKVNILKLKINRGGLKSIIENTIGLLEKKKKFYICAPNAYLTVKANEDDELLKIINNAEIVIPDGMSTVWYSRTFKDKNRLLERIDGYSFFYELSKISNNKGYSYFFFGGSDEDILRKMKTRLNKDFKKISVKGYYSPPFMKEFKGEINELIVKKINECRPDILWVGLSAPKQEKWIYENFEKLNIKMAMGIGAVFNFYSGEVQRAPKWMQKIGTEWLYRIYIEPRRLFIKYMVYNTKFIILMIKDLLKRYFNIN